jgi:hypothetical protein
MKGFRFAVWLLSLGGCAALAHAQDVESLHMDDAAWVRDAGDRLARCAGTYRGAAAVMRSGGREQGAGYADSVASGALFAAYLLLTSPEALAAKVLDGVDPSVHIEALSWGTKRNFIEKGAEQGQVELLRGCARTSALQSAVLRSSSGAVSAADARRAR